MLLDGLHNMSSMAAMASIIRAKPFVKWAGGKQGLADVLIRYFPSRMRRFYEPFLGGGSVLLTLAPNSAVVGDQNEWLLDTYHAIRDDWKRVAAILDTMPNTKDDYLRIRDIQPSSLGMFTKAAHFIYLNKTCFRGLFRVNMRNEFNVPYGAYQRAYYDADNLENVAQELANVELRLGDFELCVFDVTNEDFIYFDPPYYKLGGYSDFNRYTRFQFRDHDHIRLAAVCNELDQRGVRWAVSNSDTSFIRNLFDGYQMFQIENRREINLNSQERSINELLICNYDITKPKRQAELFGQSAIRPGLIGNERRWQNLETSEGCQHLPVKGGVRRITINRPSFLFCPSDDFQKVTEGRVNR